MKFYGFILFNWFESYSNENSIVIYMLRIYLSKIFIQEMRICNNKMHDKILKSMWDY